MCPFSKSVALKNTVMTRQASTGSGTSVWSVNSFVFPTLNSTWTDMNCLSDSCFYLYPYGQKNVFFLNNYHLNCTVRIKCDKWWGLFYIDISLHSKNERILTNLALKLTSIFGCLKWIKIYVDAIKYPW